MCAVYVFVYVCTPVKPGVSIFLYHSPFCFFNLYLPVYSFVWCACLRVWHACRSPQRSKDRSQPPRTGMFQAVFKLKMCWKCGGVWWGCWKWTWVLCQSINCSHCWVIPPHPAWLLDFGFETKPHTEPEAHQDMANKTPFFCLSVPPSTGV